MPNAWKTRNTACSNNVISTVASTNAAPINIEGKPSRRNPHEHEQTVDRLRTFVTVKTAHTTETVITHTFAARTELFVNLASDPWCFAKNSNTFLCHLAFNDCAWVSVLLWVTSIELGESEGGGPKIDILLGGAEMMVSLPSIASCDCSVSSPLGRTGSTVVLATKADRANGTRETESLCFGDSLSGSSYRENDVFNWLIRAAK